MKLKYIGKKTSQVKFPEGMLTVKPGDVLSLPGKIGMQLLEFEQFELLKEFTSQKNKMLSKTAKYKSK